MIKGNVVVGTFGEKSSPKIDPNGRSFRLRLRPGASVVTQLHRVSIVRLNITQDERKQIANWLIALDLLSGQLYKGKFGLDKELHPIFLEYLEDLDNRNDPALERKTKDTYLNLAKEIVDIYREQHPDKPISPIVRLGGVSKLVRLLKSSQEIADFLVQHPEIEGPTSLLDLDDRMRILVGLEIVARWVERILFFEGLAEYQLGLGVGDDCQSRPHTPAPPTLHIV
ncbi:MAG: hypothetical protein WAU72_02850 [Acidimicrobiia bacterium]